MLFFRVAIVATCLLVGATADAMTFQPGDIIITEFFDGWHKIDPDTGIAVELNFAHSDSLHLALDGAGNILFSDGTDSIKKLNPANSQITTLPVTDVQFIDGFVVEPSGSLLIADDNSVDRFDPAIPNTGEIASRDFFGPAGIASGPNGRVYVTEFFDDLWEVNPASGGLSPVTATEILLPDLIAVRPDGDLIVHDFNNNLLRIDPDTGGVTTFSTDLPTFPSAIAVEANGDLLMTSTDGVFRFDASTGVRTPLTTGTFFSPKGIVVIPQILDDDLPGDFNDDGIVNAADYVAWRNNPNGDYDADDYAIWQENYGRTRETGSATGRAVPEPASLMIVAIAACGLVVPRQRR
jgi:streptogramin lyase